MIALYEFINQILMVSSVSFSDVNTSSTMFCCSRGINECIPRTWVCDGEEECNDGSDELECGEENLMYTNHIIYHAFLKIGNWTCADGEYKCSSGFPTCISMTRICDRDQDGDKIEQCLDGSDEKTCGKISS